MNVANQVGAGRRGAIGRKTGFEDVKRIGIGKSTSEKSKSAEFGNFVPGVFTPVLAKHSKSFSLIDRIAIGVDRMQRNFEPMRKQVESWQRFELPM